MIAKHNVDPTLIASIEEFAEEYLRREYRPRSQRKVRSPKVIHLNRWGTQRFLKWEIATIDTPLFQRLRQIRQTGLSPYTFPSSTHTRFDHTLGVVEQAGKLLTTLIQRYSISEDGEGLNLPAYLNDVRFAGLMHDIGQGPFSHTSEEIYGVLPDMSPLVCPEGPFAGVAPHEVLAFLILETPAFESFVEELRQDYAVSLELDRIKSWIIGRPQKKEYHIGSIISGPFDADKIDYIARDALFSGLPLGVDLDRLFYALEISILDKDHLPEVREERPLWLGNVSADGRSILTVGVNSATPLEEIVFAKTLLTSAVYHHHKVRAGDCMVKAVVEYVQTKGIPLLVGKRKISFDRASDFLWLTDESFLEAAQICADQVLHNLIHDIRYRRFFVRAFVIAKDTLAQPSPEEHFDRIRKLHEFSREAEAERRRLANEICQIVKKKREIEPFQIWLDIPRLPHFREGEEAYIRVPAERGRDDYVLWPLAEFWPVELWTSQYIDHRWRGHVFCPPEFAADVSDAAQQVLESELKVKFNYLARKLCHIDD